VKFVTFWHFDIRTAHLSPNVAMLRLVGRTNNPVRGSESARHRYRVEVVKPDASVTAASESKYEYKGHEVLADLLLTATDAPHRTVAGPSTRNAAIQRNAAAPEILRSLPAARARKRGALNRGVRSHVPRAGQTERLKPAEACGSAQLALKSEMAAQTLARRSSAITNTSASPKQLAANLDRSLTMIEHDPLAMTSTFDAATGRRMSMVDIQQHGELNTERGYALALETAAREVAPSVLSNYSDCAIKSSGSAVNLPEHWDFTTANIGAILEAWDKVAIRCKLGSYD